MVAKQKIEIKLKVDVVVINGGGTGLAAGVAAVESGARGWEYDT